jgi:hypothetical protein
MPRTLKLWEGKYSMRTMMLLTIITLLTMSIAKSEEVTMDQKIKNYIVKEWNDTKEFQKAGWESAKQQNKKNWNNLKSLLGVK